MKVIKDRENKKYSVKLTWPYRFINSEFRNKEKDIPISVAEIGKKSSKPVIGQVIDKTEPRQNFNDANKKLNFHLILGMEGELVQFWVFGPEQEIKEMSSKTPQEVLILFVLGFIQYQRVLLFQD